jgi:hypothetical protein
MFLQGIRNRVNPNSIGAPTSSGLDPSTVELLVPQRCNPARLCSLVLLELDVASICFFRRPAMLQVPLPGVAEAVRLLRPLQILAEYTSQERAFTPHLADAKKLH